MRIGQGIDVHAFGPGDHVTLGGVRIAHEVHAVIRRVGIDAQIFAFALGVTVIRQLFHSSGNATWIRDVCHYDIINEIISRTDKAIVRIS